MLKENEKNEKIIFKCYKFYYEDFIIYFPVGGLDIKTNQEPITRLLNELFEYHQLTQVSSFVFTRRLNSARARKSALVATHAYLP